MQHRLRVGVEFLGLLAHHRIVEDNRVLALQLPRLEKWCPVNVFRDFGQVVILKIAVAQKLGLVHGRGLPIYLDTVFAGLVNHHKILVLLAFGMIHAQLGVFGLDVAENIFLRFLVLCQFARHRNRPRSIEHVDDRARIMRVNLDRRVDARRGGTANEQRDFEALPLHFLGHTHHFVEARRNQSAQADDVHVFEFGRFQDFRRRHHHAHVNDLVVVAAQHHAHNVFANVVHIALDGSQQYFRHAALPGGRGVFQLFLFNVGEQIRDSFFHDTGRFHHLRQEHLAFAKQIADYVHAIHERAFNHFQRFCVVVAGFFHVLVNVLHNALDQAVREALLHGGFAPSQILHFFLALRLNGFGKGHEAFGAIGAAVEQHILHEFEQVFGNIIVHGQLPGIDDAHVHARPDAVVQECRVHGFAHVVVAPETERNVAHAARNLGVRQVLLDPAGGVEKVNGVVVMFLNTRGYGQDIGVENNVLRRKTDFVHQNVVGPFADFNAAFVAVGLALLVECHHHGCRAVAQHFLGVFLEFFLAFLHRNRVDNRFALHAFQPGLNHFPLRGVNHERHAADVRLGGNQVQERGHHLHRIQHSFVHVHVNHLGAAFHLLAGHAQGGFVIAVLD